ncbi:MAG: GbsR/MarR family transcriptional regulator [Chthoniobacterales bacterium]
MPQKAAISRIKKETLAATKAASTPSAAPLNELEIEAIELFINFLKLVGMPKSIGEIYGLLFVSPEPLPVDTLIARLKISSGAASQGLKLLRSLGAVKTTYVAGDRRDHFTADLELSRFATVFIEEEVIPRLRRAEERLRNMEAYLETLPKAERKIRQEKIERLRHWVEKGNSLLPWALRFLKM